MKGLRSTPPKKQGPPILEEKKRILQRNSLVPRTTLGTGLARTGTTKKRISPTRWPLRKAPRPRRTHRRGLSRQIFCFSNLGALAWSTVISRTPTGPGS